LGEFLVDGGKALAVATPGGIVLNEHILGGVHHNIVERFTDKHVNSFVLGFRDGFRFESRGKFSGDVVFVEL